MSRARIVDARALTSYRLFVRFDDGVQGEVDLSGLVGRGVFAPWSDPDRFSQVAVDRDTQTVAWPGGIDLCPDRLYHDVNAQRK